MNVVLDIGHGPGTSKPTGAQYGTLNERELADLYGAHAGATLASLGHATRTVGAGAYLDRNEAAWAADAYASLHCNSGGHDYAAVLYEAGRDDAYRLAENIGRALLRLDGISRVIVGQWRSGKKPGTKLSQDQALGGKKLQHMAWGERLEGTRSQVLADNRGLVCIYDVPDHIPAVVIEPGFLDSPAHAWLWSSTGLQAIGRAVALGIHDTIKADPA